MPVVFIDNVMSKIWEPVSLLYRKKYEEAQALSTDTLYNQLRQIRMISYEHDMGNLSNLITSGCSHHIRGGKLSGCSMCNLHSEDHGIEAMMEVLKQKDRKAYAKIIRLQFENKRGIINQRTLQEFIFSHNFLNDYEVPDEALEELFGNSGVIRRKPLKYEFETSAKSVTLDRLKTLQKYVGRRGIWIRIGVECRDEWLRNYWLNKDTRDEHIIRAVSHCHEMGYFITANLLIGIPGLTEEQSLGVFKDTVLWLEDLGFDMYTCSILNRKDTTLQGYLYSELRNNSSLEEMGIAQEEHTGLPWLFTLIRAIYWGVNNLENFHSKLTFGQFEPSYISGQHHMAYNERSDCACNEKIFNFIKQYAFMKSRDELQALSNWAGTDPCFKAYRELIRKQKKALDIKNTIRVLGREISKSLWPGEWKKKYAGLLDELQGHVPWDSSNKE